MAHIFHPGAHDNELGEQCLGLQNGSIDLLHISNASTTMALLPILTEVVLKWMSNIVLHQGTRQCISISVTGLHITLFWKEAKMVAFGRHCDCEWNLWICQPIDILKGITANLTLSPGYFSWITFFMS